MKTQQRRFVVEIKSKGRRSAAKQGSIWGTTDLKVAARQAARVAPQLFDDEGATVDIAADEPALLVAPVPVAPAPVDTDNKESTPVALKSVEPIVAVAAVIEEARPSTAGNTGAKAQPPRSVSAAKQNPTVTDIALTDDLAPLELENRRLKSLLAERLRQQNRQLRTMLERFDGDGSPPGEHVA